MHPSGQGVQTGTFQCIKINVAMRWIQRKPFGCTTAGSLYEQ